MSIYMIAVHYKDISMKRILGFRFIDSESRNIVDQPYNNAARAIMNNSNSFSNIKYDRKSNELKGTNGAINRYPSLCNNKLIKNSIIILNSIDNIGYRVVNYEGKMLDISTDELIKSAKQINIANGKLIEKSGSTFISAISGNYDNINISKSTLSKTIEVNNIEKQNINNVDKKESTESAEKNDLVNKKINNTNTNELSRRYGKSAYYPKVVTTSTPNKESKLKEIDTETGMTVEQKLVYCMLEMKTLRPFYYSIYSALKKVEARKIDNMYTMGVSTDTLYFNSDFVMEMSLPELLFIMLHEVCHIAMRHGVRVKTKDPHIWNVACDYYVNKFLADEFGLREKNDEVDISVGGRNIKIKLPQNGLFNKKVDINIDTPEKIYEEILSSTCICNLPLKPTTTIIKGNGEKKGNHQHVNNQQGNNQQGNNQQVNNQQLKGEQVDNTKGNSEQQGNNRQENNQQGNNQQGNNQQGNNQQGNNQQSGNQAGNGNYSFGANGSIIRQSNFRGDNLKIVSDPTGSGMDLVVDGKSSNLSEEQLEQLYNSILRRAVTVHKQKHSFGGECGSYLERIVEKELAPKVNWVQLLRNKLTKASQTVNSYTAPDKRFISRGMTIPGPKKLDNDTLERVKVCVDTSGSITDRDLGIALGQISQLLKKFNAEAELLYWDTQVRLTIPFTSIDEILKQKPLGGGGTDANCVFKKFYEDREYKPNKKGQPSIIIMFTDGYFRRIDEKYKKYRDTIWVINNDDDDFIPPFGLKAQLKDGR